MCMTSNYYSSFLEDSIIFLSFVGPGPLKVGYVGSGGAGPLKVSYLSSIWTCAVKGLFLDLSTIVGPGPLEVS
jgi:hypothetical protein